MLVERARQRQYYSRPWGITIEPDVDDDENVNESNVNSVVENSTTSMKSISSVSKIDRQIDMNDSYSDSDSSAAET